MFFFKYVYINSYVVSYVQLQQGSLSFILSN